MKSTLDARQREGSMPHTDEREQVQNKATPWMIAAALKEFTTPPQDRINTSSHGSMLVRFRSPAAQRLQVRSVSCGIWMPQDPRVGIAEAFAFMTAHAPDTPSLAIALDASCLIQIGQERDDERMMLEGKRMYCDALRFLRWSLARPAKERSDALLATILVLQVAEANVCMHGADWRNHTPGIAALMREKPRGEWQASPFGWLQLVQRQFATFHLWDGLIARRRMEECLPDDVPALLTIAQAVPGALEISDEVLRGHFDAKQTLLVADRLKELETDLAKWTTDWNRCMRDAPFEMVPAYALPFPKRPRCATVFPQLIRFNDLTTCLDHIVCSASMLAVKRAMLDLALLMNTHNYAEFSGVYLPDPRTLRVRTTACADSLCMALPYLCEPEHGKFGKVVTASPLHLATEWYRYLEDESGSKQAARKLAWCKDAAASIHDEGVRMLN